jgi:hypothetical protein
MKRIRRREREGKESWKRSGMFWSVARVLGWLESRELVRGLRRPPKNKGRGKKKKNQS